MMLTGQTRVVGVFGDPVAHSLSPLMQNAAIQAAAIDAVYVPFHVTSDSLPAAVESIRRLGLLGVNLTIPHKEAVLPLVDELASEARLAGSVNTIVRKGERLIGHNTDGSGLLQALVDDLGFNCRGSRILLLGAGGACRAVAAAVAEAGAAWVGVANRTPGRAERLSSGLATAIQGTGFASFALDERLPEVLDERVDLLINTTSVGLHGDSFRFPVLQCVRPGGAVYDAVYGPAETPLVLEARSQGLVAADGLGMLAAQGAKAFSLWFALTPPLQIMRQVLGASRR